MRIVLKFACEPTNGAATPALEVTVDIDKRSN